MARAPLFDPLIPRIAGVASAAVDYEGSNSADLVQTTDGRYWVRKHRSNMGPGQFASEAIGWLLSKEVGAPVSDAAVHSTSSETSWLSNLVAPVLHWDESKKYAIENLGEVGAMLALDAVMSNVDRHERNVLLEPLTVSTFKLWSIDLGLCFPGQPQFSNSTSPPTVKNHLKGLPLRTPGLRKGAIEAVRTLSALTERRLLSIVTEACDVAAIDGAEAFFQILRDRIRLAKRIVWKHNKNLRAVS